MTRFVFTADIHLKNWKDNLYDEDNNPVKLVEILNTFENICKYCYHNSISKVIIGGDINDTKSLVSVNSFVLFREILSKYDAIDFYVIPGNHDFAAGYSGYRNATELLVGPKNVHVISSYKQVNIEDIKIDFVPYSHNVNDVLKNCNGDILISHFGLSDAFYSSGMLGKSSISSKMLKKWKLVLLGDYHTPQNINNVYYSGSLIPLTRAESGEEKRFLDITVNSKDDLKVESIPTDGYRKYYRFKLNEDTNFKNLKSEIEKLKSENHYVILEKEIKDIPKTLLEFGGIQIIDNYEEDTQIRGINSYMKIEDQMEKWMSIEAIPEEEFNLYLQIGVESIRDVENV